MAYDYEVEPSLLDEQEEKGPELPRKRRMPNAKIKNGMRDLYSYLGIAVFPFDPEVGQTIVSQSEEIAEQWAKVADVNPNIKRALELLISGGTYTGLVGSHLPIIFLVGKKYGPKKLREFFEATEERPSGDIYGDVDD